MDKKREYIVEICTLLLCLLFAYTAISKIYDWQGTKNGLHNQVFPNWIADILLYGLPPVELVTAILLLYQKTRIAGLWLSILLMTAFTIYVGLVMIGIFGRIPCSCGGILNTMGWGEHLVFNLVFLLLALIGLYVLNKQTMKMKTV